MGEAARSYLWNVIGGSFRVVESHRENFTIFILKRSFSKCQRAGALLCTLSCDAEREAAWTFIVNIKWTYCYCVTCPLCCGAATARLCQFCSVVFELRKSEEWRDAFTGHTSQVRGVTWVCLLQQTFYFRCLQLEHVAADLMKTSNKIKTKVKKMHQNPTKKNESNQTHPTGESLEYLWAVSQLLSVC